MERVAQLTVNKTASKVHPKVHPEVHSKVKCPYCLDSIDKTTVNKRCADCGAEMHRACRYEHGRCASCASWNFEGEIKEPETGMIHWLNDFMQRNPLLCSLMLSFASIMTIVGIFTFNLAQGAYSAHAIAVIFFAMFSFFVSMALIFKSALNYLAEDFMS